jgi:hypothetical protein
MNLICLSYYSRYGGPTAKVAKSKIPEGGTPSSWHIPELVVHHKSFDACHCEEGAL